MYTAAWYPAYPVHRPPLRKKHDDRRRPHRRVSPRERQRARLFIDPERGDRIRPLIARVKKITRRVDREAARIIAPRPRLARERQLPLRPHREYADAVVQPVRRVDESSIARHPHLRREIRPRESLRQTRNLL